MEKLPEHNTLPLRITESEPLAKGGTSSVWSVEARDAAGRERLIALKQAHQEHFASDAEMRKSKEFYDFIKQFPGFGRFVPETLYFKARPHEGAAPQSYSLQRLLHGTTIDRMTDEQLYADPALVRELLEFAHAAQDILKATRHQGVGKPDFGVPGDASRKAQIMGNLFAHPRYTRNILITDAPDAHGQRVWFVDTGQNPDERESSRMESIRRHTAGRGQELQLGFWARQLERRLATLGGEDVR